MSSFHAPQKIWNLGHSAIRDLLTVPVVLEEKIDGSFFQFGMFREAPDDPQSPMTLRIRSKGADIYPSAPPTLFAGAVATAIRLFESLQLVPGWTYRGEALQTPKHNALAYDRIPTGHVVLFDVLTAEETYLPYSEKQVEADRVGLELAPALFCGMMDTEQRFREYIARTSMLGGQTIEGVVIKPVGMGLFGVDGKALMGKYVSESFRETHKASWSESNPSRGDVLAKLIEELSAPARYQKAVIHLRELGRITDDVKDIGAIIGMTRNDLVAETKDYIKDRLYQAFADDIIRGAVKGIPQWYKDQLVARQFEQPSAPVQPGLMPLE